MYTTLTLLTSTSKALRSSWKYILLSYYLNLGEWNLPSSFSVSAIFAGIKQDANSMTRLKSKRISDRLRRDIYKYTNLTFKQKTTKTSSPTNHIPFLLFSLFVFQQIEWRLHRSLKITRTIKTRPAPLQWNIKEFLFHQNSGEILKLKLFTIPLSVSIPSILIQENERALCPLVALHRLLNLLENFHLNFDIQVGNG